MDFTLLGTILQITTHIIITIHDMSWCIGRQSNVMQPIPNLQLIEEQYIKSLQNGNTGLPLRDSGDFNYQLGFSCGLNYAALYADEQTLRNGNVKCQSGLADPYHQYKNHIVLYNEELRDFNGGAVQFIFCICYVASNNGGINSSSDFLIAKDYDDYHYFHFEPIERLNNGHYTFRIKGYYEFSRNFTDKMARRTSRLTGDWP